MKNDLCCSCRFCDIKTMTVHRPLFSNSWQTQEVQALTKWCNRHSTYKHRFQVKNNCGYKPKSGQLQKNIWQTELSQDGVYFDV